MRMTEIPDWLLFAVMDGLKKLSIEKYLGQQAITICQEIMKKMKELENGKTC
jgi:hypothetical protein